MTPPPGTRGTRKVAALKPVAQEPDTPVRNLTADAAAEAPELDPCWDTDDLEVMATDETCGGCGRTVTVHEERGCAFCRARYRGDRRLLCHDARGWIVSRRLTYSKTYHDPRLEVERGPCGCGTCRVAISPALNDDWKVAA